MRIFLEILLALALFAAMAFLWRASARVCFTPVPRAKDAQLYTVIAASGSGAGLEQTVGSLLWLAAAAGGPRQIIIADNGLDTTGARCAELLSRDKRVAVCALADISHRLEECSWKGKN